MKILPIKDWDLHLGKKPVIISGPCSAENEQQVMQTAQELSTAGIKIFRAGIWKPRTRPNAFEGVGSRGLPWMEKVKKEYGMLVSTEVANGKHVYKALRANIDILWIGARTTANPFAVQEIADALKGVNIPIFVKNPVNPEVDLWIGSIERLAKAGLDRVGAIHRGVSSMEEKTYRNDPKWQMPIDLKQRIPEISLLCDPSHIAGKRELIPYISQKAMDLNFDGLMIESHCNPKNALTDAKQQVKSSQLPKLLKKLIVREVQPKGISYHPLENKRKAIDILDGEILELIRQRMEIASEIGKYKKENNMTILQANRWKKLLSKHLKWSSDHKLSKKVTSKVFSAIHQESIRQQTKIMNQ